MHQSERVLALPSSIVPRAYVRGPPVKGHKGEDVTSMSYGSHFSSVS